MTRWTASAPGKLVLLGDYAVLDGAPALAVAVDRRAHVAFTASDASDVVIAAPQLGLPAASARVAADGHLTWPDAAAGAAPLGLVTALWNGLAEMGLAPRTGGRLSLDTSAFFGAVEGATQCKLGLGSSAALSVALAAVLAAASGSPDALRDPRMLARLVAWHRAWQGGRGSGVDIAASWHGGLITYRGGAAPSCTSAAWPPAGTACLFVWSEAAVSTAGYLQRLAAWRASHAVDYAARMGELVALAAQMPAALGGAAADFVALVAAYGVALARFAAATGLAIFSPAQQQAAQLAAQHGAAFKPCGAGGDFGLIVADAAPQLETVRRAIMAHGLRVVGLAVEPQGVQGEVL